MLMQLSRLLSSPLTRHAINTTKLRVEPIGFNPGFTVRHFTSPLNKKVKQTELVKEEEEEYEVEEYEPAPEPVPHKLMNRLPVEYHGVSSQVFNDDTYWLPVYRVPYLKSLYYVIRGKVYLTAVTTGGVMYSISQIMLGNCAGSIWQAGAFSLFSLVGMVYIGDYFRRLVVQIYASEDLEYVRLCRFSFFGKRKDIILPKDCVVRLPEINRSIRHPMMNVRFRLPEGDKIDYDYDNYEFYELGLKLPLGLGGVLDEDRFQAVMGYMLAYRIGG